MYGVAPARTLCVVCIVYIYYFQKKEKKKLVEVYTYADPPKCTRKIRGEMLSRTAIAYI